MGWLSKRDPHAPTEILNWRLWYGCLVFGLMGAARGIDEGLIGTSATLPSFINRFNLEDPALSEGEQAALLGNIASMVQMGSIGGALLAFFVTDKIGRLWATRQLCILWIVGITIFLTSSLTGSHGQLYAGRFIAGLGIGQTCVVAPTYLAETAPKFVRGLCVGFFSGSVYLGIMLAYFASWGSKLHIADDTQLQWVIPNLMHIYFAVVIGVLSFGALESPRWLLKKGRPDKAAQTLSKLRKLPEDHWYVQSEMLDIVQQLEREAEATHGTTWFAPIRELVTIPANQYRLMLSIFSQLLSQWSGASSITIYAVEYFKMVGISGQKEGLFATVIFGIVKLCSSLICAFFLIDYIGRKRSLMTGISLQFVSMLYMAIFLLIDTTVGDEGASQSPSQRAAAKGALGMIYVSGFGWALGWNSIQYLINSEIYPLRLRALGGSIAMSFHFVNQYGNSKAVPSMFVTMSTGGTLMFFSIVTFIGLVWAWFFLPELANKSLESVDAVFALPWYQIGRKGKELTMNMGGHVEEMEDEKAKVERLEEVRADEKY